MLLTPITLRKSRHIPDVINEDVFAYTKYMSNGNHVALMWDGNWKGLNPPRIIEVESAIPLTKGQKCVVAWDGTWQVVAAEC